MPRRSKNADPPSRGVSKGKEDVQKEMKKLTWFQRVMIHMNVCLHKENHQAYKERKLIIHNQHKLYKEL